MKRGWKILIGALVALAILLAVNTIVLNQETKAAEVTVSGGRILDLPGGAVQVVEQGPTVGKPARRDAAAGPPIVLLHCFGCSLHWWDRMVPLLARRHRVIRIDLLGFGGSEKPKSGYSMEEQGRLVALALGKLQVQGAVVVGHSLGFERGDRARRRVERAGRPPGGYRRRSGPQLRQLAVLGQAHLRRP